MTKNKHKSHFDLEERTAKFGERILDFVRKIKPDHVSRPIITQLVKAGTSVGANYMEATGAESRSDFRHKISICKKESKESKHFLRMLARCNPDCLIGARELWQEAQEFTLIFSAITRNTSS